jgi:hypothetical protein
MKPFGQGEKQQLQKGKKKSWLGHLRRYGATFMKGSTPLLTLLLGEDCLAF